MEYSTHKLQFFNTMSNGVSKMDVIFLVSTALSVSADSFLCGLSLYVPTKSKNKAVLVIAVSVLFLCFIGAFLGAKLGLLFSKYASLIGGGVLMLIALIETANYKNENLLATIKDTNLHEYFLAGFAVGLDGLVGSFTLSLIGFNPFLVVGVITILHVLLLYVSISISTEFLLKHAIIKQVAPFLIFVLGLYKVLCYF